MDFQTSTKTITMFQFELTEGEALNVCADPSDFQRELRKALNEGPHNGSHVAEAVTSVKRRSVDKPAKKQSKAKFPCEQCDREFASAGYLARHVRTAHEQDADGDEDEDKHR